MDKMAFLILAHNDPQMLKKLVQALDYEKFDIYIHLDARVDIGLFHFEEYNLQHASLVIINKRERVYWGDYSIVQATINMYEEASQRYSYIRYITLSGNDYPLKSNCSIFEALKDTSIEFIMGTPNTNTKKVENYHFMKDGLVRKCFARLFSRLNIRRNKKPFMINGGVQSIFCTPMACII